MELVLKSNNEQSLAKIIALAERLNVSIERKNIKISDAEKISLKDKILNFEATMPSPFGDALNWEKEQREDRHLPFV